MTDMENVYEINEIPPESTVILVLKYKNLRNICLVQFVGYNFTELNIIYLDSNQEINRDNNMNEVKGLVSVIIPTYNRRKTILRAVKSVLDQTYDNLEIIVVDDGSTDDTENIIKNCADKRVIYIKNSERRGAASARNDGIKQAHGEYIAFQDSDDVWHKNKLELQLNALNSNKLDMIFCPYIRTMPDGTKEWVPDKRKYSYEEIRNSLPGILKKTNIIGTPTMLLKKYVLDGLEGFDESLGKYQDYELSIRIVQKYKIGFYPEPLLDVFWQNDSITNNKDIEWGAYLSILEKHKSFLDVTAYVHHFCNAGYMFDGYDFDFNKARQLYNAVGTESIETVVEYLARKALSYLDVARQEYSAFEEKLRNQGFYIYGAGIKGRAVYERLKKKELYPKAFVVTDSADTMKRIDDIEILGLYEIKENDIPMIIAVADVLRPQLVSNLIKKNIKNYCIYPY